MGFRGVLMAKFYVGKGLEDYITELKKLEDVSDEMIERAVYEGAKIVADEIRTGINDLNVSHKHGTEEEKVDGITNTQKQGLLDGFGISVMQNDQGYVNVKLGFDGYNGAKTKKYPNGQPNAMIARSVVSGTSFRKKNDFISKAVYKNRKKAEEQLQKQFRRILYEKATFTGRIIAAGDCY